MSYQRQLIIYHYNFNNTRDLLIIICCMIRRSIIKDFIIQILNILYNILNSILTLKGDQNDTYIF